MEKPKNWDNVEPAQEFGDYETLELGGHVCKIVSAKEYTGMTGNTSLQICVDIDGNDKQKGFYQKQYDNNTNNDKKWPIGATKYISLKEDEKCVAMFKGFITTLENSNSGFKWNFDESKLVGLKLVGVWGLEEYEKSDKIIATATKLTQFRSLDKLSDVKIPKVKLLDGTFLDYNAYINKSNISDVSEDPYKDFGSGTEDIGDPLPF